MVRGVAMSKLKSGLSALSILCLSVTSVDALAKDPIVLDPTSRWFVNFAPDRCTIVRSFSEGDDAIALRISQFVPSSSLELMLLGHHAKLRAPSWRAGSVNFPLKVSLGPDTGVSAEASANQGSVDDGNVIIVSNLSFHPEPLSDFEPRPVRNFLPEDQQQALATMERIEFAGSIRRDLALNTGAMANVFKVLNDCTYNLMGAIGLDPDASRARSMPPVLVEESGEKMAREIQARYPSAAPADRRMAILRVRLIVEDNGSVGECTIIGTTNIDDFGKGVCDAFRGTARYSPALDAEGRPMRSWHLTTIRYMIPS